MKTLSLVYWSRVGLGFVAAFICVILKIDNLLSGASLAVLFYILTYYVYRFLFIKKEGPSKLFKEAIFAYFLTWLVSWSLLFTLFKTSILLF